MDELAAFERMDAACSQCHQSAVEDVAFFDVFDLHAGDLDLPRGVVQVGFGLSPALGDDGERSKLVAAAFRAALWPLFRSFSAAAARSQPFSTAR